MTGGALMGGNKIVMIRVIEVPSAGLVRLSNMAGTAHTVPKA